MRATEELLRDLRSRLGRGRDNAVPTEILCRDLQIRPRTLQHLVNELIDRGELIGSRCGAESGYFLCENEEDVERGLGHIIARARASFERVKKVRRAAERKFGPGAEILRLFDLEGGVP